jgi:hypothetical protein
VFEKALSLAPLDDLLSESDSMSAASSATPVPADADEAQRRRHKAALASKIINAPFQSDEFFGRQPSTTRTLPDPTPLLENLTRCVIEVLAGARELEQISRWVSDEVYRHLLKRVVLSARARRARNQPVARPNFAISSTQFSEPSDGVVEGVVIVSGRARTRAVAIRLEGLDNRWRATAINVL